jgi:hypothetical protein
MTPEQRAETAANLRLWDMLRAAGIPVVEMDHGAAAAIKDGALHWVVRITHQFQRDAGE